MSVNERMRQLLAAFEKTTYIRWLRREGLPIHEGYGIEDVRQLELAPWPRTGGTVSYTHLTLPTTPYV